MRAVWTWLQSTTVELLVLTLLDSLWQIVVLAGFRKGMENAAR